MHGLLVLQESLVLAYNPKNTSTFSLYNQPSPFKQLSSQPSIKNILASGASSSPTSQRKTVGFNPLAHQPTVVPASTKVMLMGVASQTHQGLATAVDENGGIGVFLFLFARVSGQSCCDISTH